MLALNESRGGIFDEIENCAMIRQIHVYGPAVPVGSNSSGEAQHTGIGQRLVDRARSISESIGFRRLSVIAAIGTREYYARLGFDRGDFYMAMDL